MSTYTLNYWVPDPRTEDELMIEEAEVRLPSEYIKGMVANNNLRRFYLFLTTTNKKLIVPTANIIGLNSND